MHSKTDFPVNLTAQLYYFMAPHVACETLTEVNWLKKKKFPARYWWTAM